LSIEGLGDGKDWERLKAPPTSVSARVHCCVELQP
jgi:hypothetical protein